MKPTNEVRQVHNLPNDNNPKLSLIGKIAGKFHVDPSKLMDTLKSTAFKQRNGQPPTNEQMMALLVVADQYGLNPFTKEIYAFPDQQNGIVPVVGVDGWSRIINSHKEFDGLEFRCSETTIQLDGLDKPVFEWIECIMYRKDRERPTIIREYMDEIYRAPFQKKGSNGPYVIKGPWQTHPKRFARHKVLIQTARIALGYTGIYDQDEADRIIESSAVSIQSKQSIEFDSSPQQTDVQILPEPQQTSEIVQDLSQYQNVQREPEYEMSQFDDLSFMDQQEQQTDVIPMNAVVQTKFGDISAKDQNMISQMVQFTRESESWDTTKDTFKERYSGATLTYAEAELKAAFNDAYPGE